MDAFVDSGIHRHVCWIECACGCECAYVYLCV